MGRNHNGRMSSTLSSGPVDGPLDAPALRALDGATPLADWGVIRASGEEAGTFLHGQLTQDVQRLGPVTARLAGYCSPKGRLLATFVVWRDAAGDLLLACSADVLPAVLKRLSMFVLRAKCKLSDASGTVPLVGVAGPSALATLGPAVPSQAWQVAVIGDATAVRLPDAVVDGASLPRLLVAGPAPAGLPVLDSSAWRWLEAMSGVPRIMAATVEQFVPQMVNLELVGGVNFQKGCYPGQEIVARSQYRGTLKRRAALVRSHAPLAPGQEVFHDADPGQPAGMVVNAGSVAGHHAALVELKLAAWEGGRLTAGPAEAGIELRRLSLPYPLPSEAAA